MLDSFQGKLSSMVLKGEGLRSPSYPTRNDNNPDPSDQNMDITSKSYLSVIVGKKEQGVFNSLF